MKAVSITEKEFDDPDILMSREVDGHRIIVAMVRALMGSGRTHNPRNAFAACRILLDIRGQRKHRYSVSHVAFDLADPSIPCNCAVREGNEKPVNSLYKQAL